MHDPDDVIAAFEGSLKLMEQSQTRDGDKSLLEIEGGLHDLLTNKLTYVVDTIVEWVRRRAAMDD
jgi:hypothetical protein